MCCISYAQVLQRLSSRRSTEFYFQEIAYQQSPARSRTATLAETVCVGESRHRWKWKYGSGVFKQYLTCFSCPKRGSEKACAGWASGVHFLPPLNSRFKHAFNCHIKYYTAAAATRRHLLCILRCIRRLSSYRSRCQRQLLLESNIEHAEARDYRGTVSNV